jgi:hypothetical protein
MSLIGIFCFESKIYLRDVKPNSLTWWPRPPTVLALFLFGFSFFASMGIHSILILRFIWLFAKYHSVMKVCPKPFSYQRYFYQSHKSFPFALGSNRDGRNLLLFKWSFFLRGGNPYFLCNFSLHALPTKWCKMQKRGQKLPWKFGRKH